MIGKKRCLRACSRLASVRWLLFEGVQALRGLVMSDHTGLYRARLGFSKENSWGTNRGLSDPELGVVGYNHVLLLGPGSDWRSGVLGRRQSLRQGCRRQALQEAVAGGRQRSFDILRRNRAYPELDGIITALVCPLDGVKVQ